ncbi:MAG: nucleoside deaminase [Bacteroidales bacterium]|nr:nucleoside deaminase [Bacteroidales bacterium]MCF8391174.1 nucleoside deaminase [Bacteroidales bacterium]
MSYTIFSDEYFMNEALKEAEKAFSEDEIPVGAVIVINNKIIARGYNMTENLTDVTAHAEMIAITAAENYLGNKFLDDCIMYVTLEPCLMCAGAINWARLGTLVFGASEPKFGYRTISEKAINPKIQVKTGILEDRSAALLKNFFEGKRDK